MKKLILFFAIAFLSAGVYAQVPVSFGPKVGFTTSKLTTDLSGYKEDVKNGFQAGAFVRVKLKKFYLQPEIYYGVKGGTIDTANFNYDVDLNTLDVPILVGYRVLGKNAFNFRIFAGPVASFIVNKKISLNGNELAEEIADKSIKDAIWGMQMGAGIDLLIFTLDVRYELGVNDIGSDDSGMELKSNTFVISLGWKIL
ncbi:MAG: PorT family protein [Bacteroidales bacterium]|nr:PorT family protein [Bacteroidales bacterium]